MTNIVKHELKFPIDDSLLLTEAPRSKFLSDGNPVPDFPTTSNNFGDFSPEMVTSMLVVWEFQSVYS